MENATPKFAATNADSSSNTTSDFFDVRIQRITREFAHRMIKTGMWNEWELTDLCQDLSIILWKAETKFDKLRSNKYTFAKCVLRNRVKNLIDEKARKRKDMPSEIWSLEYVVNDDGDLFSDLIDLDDYETAIGNRRRPANESQELIESEMYAISLLPSELQKICYDILAGESITSLAKKHNISRSWFREKHISKIRKVFAECGLLDFCRRA